MMNPEDRCICAERVGRTLVSATSPNPVLDHSFESYIAQVEADVALHGPYLCFLSYSPTQGPSALQRRLLQEREPGLRLKELRRVALISESTLVRGAITAAAWLIPAKRELKAFSASQVNNALVWLAEVDPMMDPTRTRRVLATLAEAAGHTSLPTK